VADVRDVDDVGHLVPLPLEHAAQRVGEDVGAQITDVLVGVHGGATRIDVRPSGLEGYELLELAPERVEQSKRQAGHPDLLHHTALVAGPHGWPQTTWSCPIWTLLAN
jgi:hypothetical protein